MRVCWPASENQISLQPLPWPKRSPAAVQLKQHNAALALQLLRLREQLTNKEHYANGLEVLLRERLARIDELSATIDRLRDQNKKLNQENEHLAAMLKHQPTPPDRFDASQA